MVKIPERSYSHVYEDDRWKDKYALTVRHASSIEILRFRTREEAIRQQEALRQRGYVMTNLFGLEEYMILCCSKCGIPLEPYDYDGDLECPNAQYPNKTKHGKYYGVSRRFVAAELLDEAIAREKSA